MKRETRLYLVLWLGIVFLIAVWTPEVLGYMKFKGNDTYKIGKFEASRGWFLVPAYFGDHQAQTLLGTMYAIGQGGPQDAAEGICWLERAASADQTEAQLFLGTLYSIGVVAKRDPEKAIFWLSKAAGHGDKMAGKLLSAYRLRSGTM